MDSLLRRFAAIACLACLAACSSDPSSGSTTSGNDRPTCDSNERYDDRTERCIPVAGANPPDGGTSSGDGGTNSSGTGDTGGGDAGAEACGPRTSYVQVLRPNVFLMLDTSDSMEGTKLRQAKRGLNTVADQLADDVRWGVGRFPKNGQCAAEELLSMGSHSSSTLKSAWRDLGVAGGTPTGAALYQMRFKPPRRGTNWLTETGDERDAERSKAVILVTDGEPNDAKVCRENVRDPVEEARRIAEKSMRHEREVPVYVIGFDAEADPSTLNAVARAGGTDAPGNNRFFTAMDATELSGAIRRIASGTVVCARALDPAPPEGSSIGVEIGGKRVTRGAENGFVYDADEGAVRLEGRACEQLKSKSRDGTTLEIDVGCPDCNVEGESCQTKSDCCRGVCKQGTCVEQCREPGAECTENADCCSGSCAGANPVGTCRAG